ncbi:hypothetical protein [Synechococcus sp. MIT S9504]|uniref:hypothetical protein n=1 Tax=Synechococcus sp. MIT S9504 TaxID=1801628 RepID=UPI000AA46423|nr:hypothetical protein [Synechococcus sp. MIT S9504]
MAGLITTSAEAVPTHITCADITSTWNGSPYTLFTRQVFFDFDANRATINDKERHLKITPAELKIYETGKNRNGKRTSYMFRVDRSTLKYNHAYEFIGSGIKFISNGQCQVAKVLAGNKI